MSDLVERLMVLANAEYVSRCADGKLGPYPPADTMREAAEKIDALIAELFRIQAIALRQRERWRRACERMIGLRRWMSETELKDELGVGASPNGSQQKEQRDG